MTARLRIAVAVAILLALAAHPVAHPMAKECPCTHAVGTPAFERAESFILQIVTRTPVLAESASEGPEIAVRASRAPPAA